MQNFDNNNIQITYKLYLYYINILLLTNLHNMLYLKGMGYRPFSKGFGVGIYLKNLNPIIYKCISTFLNQYENK